MSKIFAPKIPKPSDPRINVEEFASVSTPVSAEGAAAVRQRMAAARNRTDRAGLQIPLFERIGQGLGGLGISIPGFGR